MKFLMILPSAVRGGVEEYALKITTAAVNEGWEVHTAFPKTNKTTSLIEDFTTRGVHYHRLEISEHDYNRLRRIISHPFRFLRTLLLLLKLKPDIVQITLPWLDSCLASLLACSFLRTPTAVRFGLVPPDPMPLSLLKQKLYAWARNRNQQWFAVSDNNRKLICNAFQIPSQEVLCIQNGTKIQTTGEQRFSIQHSAEQQSDRLLLSLAELRQQVRQELALVKTAQIILTVGRLSNQKGYSDLIPTIPHLVQEFPNLCFVWVGEGDRREDLTRQLQQQGLTDRVRFLGYRSDIPRLLAAADLFVFPTHYEGHPSALLEAMAYGLAIVTSDASGIPEIVEHGVHGLVFRSGDRDELLAAIHQALRQPEAMQTMAYNAQQRVSHFSEEKMYKETLDLLRSLSCETRLTSADVELS